MTFPSDEVMCVFRCIKQCVEFRLIEENGTMAVRVNDWDFVEVDGAVVDELMARGWLLVEGDTWEVTEAGRYRCNQYFARKKVKA